MKKEKHSEEQKQKSKKLKKIPKKKITKEKKHTHTRMKDRNYNANETKRGKPFYMNAFDAMQCKPIHTYSLEMELNETQ